MQAVKERERLMTNIAMLNDRDFMAVAALVDALIDD